MRSGPPTEPPNWFMWKGGLAEPARLLKKSLASSLSLRRNSKSEPWKALVPLLVVTLRTPPPKRPNSAAMLLLSTLNSTRASTLGRVVIWLKKPVVEGAPSIMISLE